MTDAEIEAVRLSVHRDRPFGSETWTRTTAKQPGLEYSLRKRGQQPKDTSPIAPELPNNPSSR